MTLDAEILEECALLQKEEMEVLESIYPDYITQNLASDGSFKLEFPIEFNEQRTVNVLDDSALALDQAVSLPLSTLPPLLLHIMLPTTYPVNEAPTLLSLRATHLWLQTPHITRLQTRLVDMWNEVVGQGQGVLYTWIEYLHSGEFLSDIGITDGTTIQIHHPSPPLLAGLLNDHQTLSLCNTFNQTSYPCSICMEHFKGSKCLQLSCSHIFCRVCLQDFWGLCIREGEISRVGCPDPECVKAGREATEEEVARVVSGGDEEIRRWRWLREKVAVERDPSIIHCPMSWCQRPVPKPESVQGQEDSGWERLRTCGACSYSFCAFCKRTWHGPHTDCPISASETVVREYLALPDDSPERTTMERRFGKKNIQKLVRTFNEEQANKKWLEASTMACPGCGVNVEKSLGCNHMTCVKCKAHFCYRCGEKLNAANPYKHFSTQGQRCYNQLFDFQSGGDDDWVFEFGWEEL
ncbi:e3 ubiquitin-protein ligase rnf14 [Moniliophthora roreri MCA 2997]|uniref:RBR-type E3 ubiquitin transferase n=1 Tax=Moniliophthora roreri (strain MCA 2997) TaxID=1381753 RepID=V2WG89_MONRO|nr:e3 ubiquitin-protein ligase rnf14 [Moniliophthora roreri MCA 2997]